MNSIKFFMFINICVFLNSFSLQSQTLAVTELGDTIYIYNNGRWSYDQFEEIPQGGDYDNFFEKITFDTIKTPFTYPEAVNRVVENKNKHFKIHYNDKKWARMRTRKSNKDAEFLFDAKYKDVWCMVISEETSIRGDYLFRLAKNNFEQKLERKVEVLKTEVRTVNGVELMRGVFKIKRFGAFYVYDNYYYSDEGGSVQFITWAGEKSWKKNGDFILDFLNGFVVNKKN